MIVDIDCEDGTTQIARTVQEHPETYTVNFLERNRFRFYDFRNSDEEVCKTSVSGFYDVDSLEETGLFVKIPQGYELIDDSEDEDFECSTSDEDDSDEDVSLVDEDDEEEA
jgi:hypothetical protein